MKFVHVLVIISSDSYFILLSKLTGTGGEMSGGLHLSADYSPDQPLNASLSIYGSQKGDMVAGASLAVSSDPEWANFTGRSNVRFIHQSILTSFCIVG